MFKCDSNEGLLREVIVKIGLERIDTQEVTVEILLDNETIGLVMSLKFVRV